MNTTLLRVAVCLAVSSLAGLPVLSAENQSQVLSKEVLDAYSAQKDELAAAILLYRNDNYTQAIPALKKLADTSNPIAGYYYASCLESDSGINQDTTTAKALYNTFFPKVKYLAINTKDALAQHVLGLMYKNGEGTTINNPEAIKWAQKSADQGYPQAQSSLAKMYEVGKGVPKNNAIALKWYRKAAEQGDAYSQDKVKEIIQAAVMSSNASITVAPAEKHEVLSNNVTHWFNCVNRDESSEDMNQWRKIIDAVNKTVYGENEFERNRDKANVPKRLAEIKSNIYGIKLLVSLPSYNFNSKSYNLSGELHPNCMRGDFLNGHITFPAVKIDDNVAERIHTQNTSGFTQEIIFRYSRMQTMEEAYAEHIRIAGPFTSREDFIGSPGPLFRILSSKITLSGYGEIYSK